MYQGKVFLEKLKQRQVVQVRMETFSVSKLKRIRGLQKGDRKQCYTTCDMNQNVLKKKKERKF